MHSGERACDGRRVHAPSGGHLARLSWTADDEVSLQESTTERERSTVPNASTTVHITRRMVAVASIGVAAVVATVALRIAVAPNDPYRFLPPVGMTPIRTSEDIAGMARGYLDAQAGKEAAPVLHQPPDVVEIMAMPASRLPTSLPQVPAAEVADVAERVVWVAKVRGDVFASTDRPWSPADDPAPCGHLVFDDATLELLAVFPEACPSPSVSVPGDQGALGH